MTLLAVLVILPLSAQEFDRVSGGQVEVITKGEGDLSGSLGVSTLGSTEGYGATLGGTLLQDRLWFFGATSSLPAQAFDSKMTAQIGSRNSLAASFSRMTLPVKDDRAPAVPSSFLSLRYDGVMSQNFFFNATFLQLR